MLKLFSLILFYIYAQPSHSKYLNIENAPEAQEKIKLNPKDFTVKIDFINDKDIPKLLVKVAKNSVKWVRIGDLTIPKLRLMVMLKDKQKESFFLNYKDTNHTFQDHKKISYTEVTYSVFEKSKIKLYRNDKYIADIKVNIKPREENIIIDYSCSRNNIKIDIPKSDLISVGCTTKRIGKIGHEKPLLTVHWISPTLKTQITDTPINKSVFITTKSNHLKLESSQNNELVMLHIHAKIPKRLHRMFTAYGFGPSYFETKITNNDKPVSQRSEETDIDPVAPSLYFYLNYKISETSSIRGFDAATFSKSKFNNAGIYLGNDFGFSLDNRLYFSTLLGVQYLYFQFDNDSEKVSEPIFPQGVEFMYRHLFDIPNYIISGGLFLSTSSEIDYKNIWLRWGKNYFWEVNYINWGNSDFNAKTIGLSVGIPFLGLL